MLIYLLFLVLVVTALFSIRQSVEESETKAFLNKDFTNNLRGISILFITAAHYVYYIYQPVNPRFLLPSYLIYHFCALGVGFFFFCSGFGNFFSVAKSENKFYWLINHSARIFICVAILLILQFITSIHLGVFSLEIRTIFSLIKHIFTITIPPYTMWFIKELMFMYLFIYISEIIFQNKSKKLLFIIFSMLIYTLFFFITKNNASFWWKSTVCFPLGYLFAYYKNNIIEYLNKNKKYCLILIFFITAFLMLITLTSIFHFIKIAIFILESIFVMILLSVLSLYINFKSKILDFCGRYSLEIYTTHLFILSFFTKHSHLNTTLILIFLFVLTLLIVKPLKFCILKIIYALNQVYNLLAKKINNI